MRVLVLHRVRLCAAAVLAACVWAGPVCAQDAPRIQVLEVPAQARGEVSRPGLWREFSLYEPEVSTDVADVKRPILFFLHGAGRRGQDPSKVQSLPPLAAAGNGHDYPFIIAAPQVIAGRTSSEAAVLNELETFFEDVIQMTDADRSRVYIVGQSMGARATWDLLMRNPNYFAAAVPIAGWSNSVNQAAALTDIPIWAFHGRLDNTIKVERSIEIIDAIEAAGGDNARLTIYEDAGHSVWWQTLRKDSDVYPWLVAQQLPEPGAAAVVSSMAGLLLLRRPASHVTHTAPANSHR